MKKVNRTIVEIFGQNYTIVGEESEEQVKIVSRTIDKKMRKLSDAAPLMNSTSIAVLAAVNFTNELIKKEQEALELREENKLISNEMLQKKGQLVELIDEVKSLKTELSSKESKNVELECLFADMQQKISSIPELEEKNSISVKETNLLTEQNTKLNDEISLRDSELAKIKKEIKLRDSELAKIKEEIARRDSMLAKQREIVANSNNKIAELELENSNLNIAAAEEVSLLENKVLKANESLEGLGSLEQELSNSKRQIIELEKANKTQKDEIKANVSTIEKLQLKIENLNNEAPDTTQTVDKLENEVKVKSEQIADLKKEIENSSQLKSKIKELEFEIEYLQLEKSEYQKNAGKTGGNDLFSENSEKVKELEKLSTDLSAEIKLHKNTIKELERELKSQEENSSDQNLSKLQKRNAELEKEVEYLNGELPERQERINELEQEVDFLRYDAPLRMQNRIDDLENELRLIKSGAVK